jgi:putative ABC transport system permease protein
MEFGPIWRALLRNKGSYVLIALQIAVTMAIMVNAIAIMQERSTQMARPSGVDEDNVFVLGSAAFDPDFDYVTATNEDLDLIRGLPGVEDAIATNSYPLRGGGWSMELQLEPGDGIDGTGTAIYFVDEHGINTFGTNLIDGKNFSPNDINWNDPEDTVWPNSGIISKALGEELFPDETGSIVGKTVYINNNDPVKIIGVVDRLQAAWSGWERVEYSILVPQMREYSETHYVVRTEPGYRDELMPQVEQLLAESNRGRLIRQVRTMEEVRNRSYNGDAAMIKILTFIVTLLTAITGLGIVGLASFSVSRRTRQIGVRRALGATRPQILRHFMVENFIISGMGVIGGAILAIGLNVFMVEAFSITPLSWYVIPVAMLLLWTVGQIAVAGPAHRASLITPAIATRSI